MQISFTCLPRGRALGRALAAASMLATVAGCSWFETPPQARGNRVQADSLKELTPGVSTRADVTALLGSPTAKATFDDNQWIYIGSLTRPEVGRTQGVISQDVVLVTFNGQGGLEGMTRLAQTAALPVSGGARATPSPGSEASVLQQLLGNVGRFNPGGLGGVGGLGGSSTPPSGGAPGAGGGSQF